MTPAPKPLLISRGFMGFASAIAVLSLATPVYAAKFGDLTYEVRDSSITITDCRSTASGAVVIPARIAGKPVTAIGDEAFDYCREITEVTVPEGVTKIGAEVFSECDKLKKISLPDSLEKIGRGAFYHADLRHVKIPARVEIIPAEAFLLNFRLHDVEIPEGVRVIGSRAFGYCSRLESVSLPASVVDVTTESFAGADLKRIDVAPGNRAYSSVDGVLYDKNHTLLISCPSKKEGTVEVAAGVKRLAAKSFYLCESLKKVVLPESLLAIEARAFSFCTELKEVNLPNGLTAIGHHAFTVSAVGDMTIPASVKRIGGYAFAGCGYMTNVYFNGNVPSDMGRRVFDFNTRQHRPRPGFKIYFYEGATGFTEPTWLGYDTISLSPDAPVTNRLLFGAAWPK